MTEYEDEQEQALKVGNELIAALMQERMADGKARTSVKSGKRSSSGKRMLPLVCKGCQKEWDVEVGCKADLENVKCPSCFARQYRIRDDDGQDPDTALNS